MSCPVKKTAVFAVLVLALFISFGGAALAADNPPAVSHGHHGHGGHGPCGPYGGPWR